MHSPSSSLWYPILMTKRTRNAKKKVTSLSKTEKKLAALEIKAPKTKTRKRTPFADTGSILGNSLGGMFGMGSIGRNVGRFLGSGIGSIFGSGDYSLVGQRPAKNNLLTGQIPQFSTTRATNVVCHREYLGDIMGTSAFTNTQYPLNPGIATTFPWLSTVAPSYQEYKFHGVVFEFRSLITDFVTSGSPGVVIMSTNYNADATLYTSKQQMEQSEFATSVKPTVNLMHAIECAVDQTPVNEKYIRSGSVPVNQDLRLYDHGNFQFATQTNPIQNLGELWVTYCVELFKPILPLTSSTLTGGFHLLRTGATGGVPLGTTTVLSAGSIQPTVTNTNLTWSCPRSGLVYKIDLYWSGAPVALSLPGASPIGACAFGPFLFQSDTADQFTDTGATTGAGMYSGFITSSGTGVVGVQFGGGGVVLPATQLDIFMSLVDATILL